ncbi:oligoribonuclease [Actinobaculum suis]|uniref:Oligoribonuclease n=2 Tax=Actinobaculum suis TaxID=1657 RepID=A0AAW9HJJ5_9ACTO|nr:oligoribonuclease [Actinobaculum suis]MDY5153967.1 oligoribonuclease [Actinobaculum suis]
MSYHEMSTPIVWIDCEMTGLDLSRDEIVEISVVVTDSDLNPVDEGIDIVIKPSADALESMNDFVREMHTNSGLINEWDAGVSITEAEKQVLAYLEPRVEKGKAPLGGNSVGTDKTFLEKQMPNLVNYLHYRIIDVSSIKELAKRWFPRVYFASPEKFGNHRALGDIYDSIDELRYYRATLFPEGDGPSTAAAQEVASQVAGRTQQLLSANAASAASAEADPAETVAATEADSANVATGTEADSAAADRDRE